MNRKFTVLGAGLALALAATTAQAAVSIVSVQQNKPMGAAFSSNYITFDNRTVGSSANFTTGIATFAGGGFIEDGTVRYAYMTPVNDATNYLALGNSKAFKNITETISLAGAVNKFGFYWGSIDTYNSVTFSLGGTTVGSFTGKQVAAFSGSDGIAVSSNGVNTNSSAYVSFGGAKFDKVTLNVTQPNFEVDNVAIGGVPEASTWAMMLIGFGGLGGLMLHRRKTGNTNTAMLAA